MATNITTLEEALESAGLEFSQPRTVSLARNALNGNGELVIVTTIRNAKQGIVVAQESRDCVITKFPTYIRLK